MDAINTMETLYWVAGFLVFFLFVTVFLLYKLIDLSRHATLMHEKLIAMEGELLTEKVKEHEQSSELIELKNKVETTVSSDFLTGLINRQMFDDRLAQTITHSKRYQFSFALLFINIDSFKVINDALGLDAGDLLLKEIANRLRNAIRQIDTISRFGGDEFAVILSQLAKPEMAAYVAKRLLNTIAEPLQVNGQDIFLTASIGIAVYPHDGEDARELLKHADNALHQAKTKGCNHLQFYQKEMNEVSQREFLLTSSLNNQTIYQNLQIFYQPRINVDNKKIVCMEAIVRWQHPDLGLVDFKECLKIAEQGNTILQVGEWILKNVCEQFNTWRSSSFTPEKLALTVSLRQLENPHFIYHLSRLLNDFKIPYSSLIIELSELTLPKDGMGEKSLLMLHEMGVQLGINDFGMEKIALRELQYYPINYIKIASSLIHDMENKDILSIIKMIIHLATDLNRQVVAVGVESLKQAQLLKSLGCLLMQGSIISPPVPPNALGKLQEKLI